MKDMRPWGFFEVLLDSPECKVKKIVVNQGGQLSYQSHQHRTETWTCVSGRGIVTIDDQESIIEPKETVYIPAFAKHMISNASPLHDEELVFIEVQHSDEGIFDESDIIRYNDIYGRA